MKETTRVRLVACLLAVAAYAAVTPLDSLASLGPLRRPAAEWLLAHDLPAMASWCGPLFLKVYEWAAALLCGWAMGAWLRRGWFVPAVIFGALYALVIPELMGALVWGISQTDYIIALHREDPSLAMGTLWRLLLLRAVTIGLALLGGLLGSAMRSKRQPEPPVQPSPAQDA